LSCSFVLNRSLLSISRCWEGI